MLAALLTTLLFAISAICGYRTAKQMGGVEANFWRIAHRHHFPRRSGPSRSAASLPARRAGSC